MTRPRSRGAAVALAACLLTFSGSAHAAQALEPGRHVLEGPEVKIHNLAGEMRIVQGSGSSVVVEITPGGPDAARLTVDIRHDPKGRPVLHVVYPETKVVYRDGFGPGSSSNLSYNGRRYRVSGRGSGLEAHADIKILVPRGKTVHAENAVGRTFVAEVEGNISVDAASSTVQVHGVSGGLSVDVGSGDVNVSKCDANVSVDTGSGNVDLSYVHGNVVVDTGSGNIEFKVVGGGSISVDAGSGSITGSDVRATAISAQCGSGEIDFDGTSAERVALDAGSGSIHLRLDKNVDQLAIESGSGSVKLEAPANLSARFSIECPRRNLRIDFPTEIEHSDDDSAEGTIGSGQGSIRIEAGSGRVDLVKM